MENFEDLIRLIQTTDNSLNERHQAFGELVKRFQDMAYGYAYALLGDKTMAQDAAQETFITAYQHLYQLQEPRAFPGWLRRIVLTQCHRLIRKKQLLTQWIDPADEFPSNQPEPPTMIEKQELRDSIQAVIGELPETQRTATVLFYINGYSQQEVAEFMEVSVDTVKKRLQRARQQLKERMMDMVEENLREHRPSKDEQFLQMVQLATTLETVAIESQLNTIELLLVDGLDVNAPGENGQTLLHWAALQGHVEAAEFLLNHGADPNLKDKFGKTPLQWAEGKGHREVAALLRRHTL